MSLRSVHLELAEDYSSSAFIAAFARLISCRGHCTDLFCDQSTIFVGAGTELHKTFDALSYDLEFARNLTLLGTKWHFNPPSAPHFGGIWEATVKSTVTSRLVIEVGCY